MKAIDNECLTFETHITMVPSGGNCSQFVYFVFDVSVCAVRAICQASMYWSSQSQ